MKYYSLFSAVCLSMTLLASPFVAVLAQIPTECKVVAGTAPSPSRKTAIKPAVACSATQNIRVNIHFLQHDNGTGSFNAWNDGRPNNPSTALNGYASGLIWACNGQMDQNPVLRLAPGNTLTPIPKRVHWVLDGVFFDRSTYYRNGSGAGPDPQFRQYESLCVRADSVINIFLVEELPWPYTNLGIPVATGVSNRGYVYGYNQAYCDTQPAPANLWAVVASPWTNYILNGMQPWQIASTVNHELCHLLGLNHPHENLSTCPDAPPHPNYPQFTQCWNLNEPPGPNCNSWSLVSNNLMDYTANQAALSPCQIGIIQNNLNSCLRERYV